MRRKVFLFLLLFNFFSIFQVVASGMNLHLSENELIRSIFSLGDPLPSLADVASNRPSKHERVSKIIQWHLKDILMFAENANFRRKLFKFI